MSFKRSALLVAGAVVGIAALVAGCAQENMPEAFSEDHGGALEGGSGGGRAPSTASSGGGTNADATVADSGGSGSSSGGIVRPQGGPPASGQCVQALAQSLNARIAVMSTSARTATPATGRMVTLQDLFDRLSGPCASCHTQQSLGGFSLVGPNDLLLPSIEPGLPNRGAEALAHIHGDGTTRGPTEAMPPRDPTRGTLGFGSWTACQEVSCPLVLVASWLDSWTAAGYAASFTLPPDNPAPGVGDAGAPSYLMTPDVGNGLTKLGNCIPDKSIVATDETRSAALALDAKFAVLQRAPIGHGSAAEIIGLPELLSDTDLTTFDGEALARVGVIAFAPQYPLWSDDAGKLRHVRVPRGQAIYFDKTTQEFIIPPNTRFYKTFLKPIVDTDGNQSWRKVETRLIVSRADTTLADGTIQQNALFGSYVWSNDETVATLVGTGKAAEYSFVQQPGSDQPLLEGDGFTDTMLLYDTNVSVAAQIRKSNPQDLLRTLAAANAVRHYAIPSSTRCVDCHEGSPSQSFILGFRPVQLAHRTPIPTADGGGRIALEVAQGGVIEASGPDELTQLQRLIDYRVITGIASQSDVLPLESPQGGRPPRNEYEVVAQGYMLANCSHCHNPRGKPSVEFPILRNALNFLPGPNGGIYQFPLQKVSPRIKRGENGNVDIAYITPSLTDNPSFPRVASQLDAFTGETNDAPIWKPKWIGSSLGLADPAFVYAPWRSLIYRNVDTPFTATDDYAIYPHMPMNTPGFDCRAKQIIADWMVSIPAIRKRTDIDEYADPYPDPNNTDAVTAHWPNMADSSVQPYVEVTPGAPGYTAALAAAKQRLETLHAGSRAGEAPGTSRYYSCPDTSDIVDPNVDSKCHPVPREYEVPSINVPTHAHWVPIDLTQKKDQPWTPRRGDWARVLPADDVTGGSDGGALLSCGADPTVVAAARNDQQLVIDLLTGKKGTLGSGITLDKTIRDFALTPRPVGLWTDKAGCDWSQAPFSTSGEQTFADLRSGGLGPSPAWASNRAAVDARRGIIGAQRHVYTQTPGAAVFNMICINCHGENADSHGRLADNLALMTGGLARVANLRDGLFGVDSSGMPYRSAIFVGNVTGTAGVDDWAARYMAWMALGGTGVTIPPAYLTIVGNTPFLGESRSGLKTPDSANMLTIAQELCKTSLNTAPYSFSTKATYFATSSNLVPSLLWDNGDAELWLKLCGLDNPPPVIPFALTNTQKDPAPPFQYPFWDASLSGNVIDTGPLRPPAAVLRCAFRGGCGADGGVASPTFSVGDENGNVYTALTDDNLHPWCVYPVLFPSATAFETVTQQQFDAWMVAHCMQAGPDCDSHGMCTGPSCVHPPRCPDVVAGHDPTVWDDQDKTARAYDQYGNRGAINAGLSVFLYLRDITQGHPRKPTYDNCDQLPNYLSRLPGQADAGSP